LKKIIYIAGLGHSGSTMLDMALGTHPDIVGLGEIYHVFTKKDLEKTYINSTCSCGKKAKDCVFWSGFYETANKELPAEQKYKVLIDMFDKVFGTDICLLDSSKNSYDYLKFLNIHYDLSVVYLTRDFRSWAYSRFYSNKKPAVFWFFRWYLENKKLLFMLKKYNVNMIKVGYEELAVFPNYIIKKICEFAGIKTFNFQDNTQNTKSHIISGNIARTDKLKKSRFVYDIRWLTSKRISLLSFIFIFFHKLNKRLVFSNIMNGKHSLIGKKRPDFHVFGYKRKKSLYEEHN
jgi:hypothetical protein